MKVGKFSDDLLEMILIVQVQSGPLIEGENKHASYRNWWMSAHFAFSIELKKMKLAVVGRKTEN